MSLNSFMLLTLTIIALYISRHIFTKQCMPRHYIIFWSSVHSLLWVVFMWQVGVLIVVGFLPWITSTHLWLVLGESVNNQPLLGEDRMKLKKRRRIYRIRQQKKHTQILWSSYLAHCPGSTASACARTSLCEGVVTLLVISPRRRRRRRKFLMFLYFSHFSNFSS